MRPKPPRLNREDCSGTTLYLETRESESPNYPQPKINSRKTSAIGRIRPVKIPSTQSGSRLPLCWFVNAARAQARRRSSRVSIRRSN
jgi:hypothetical protein